MNIYKLFYFVVCIFIFNACSSSKKQAELLEQTKPSWLKERPVISEYYIGIGIVPKVGSPTFYEDKARQRALADIAGQINTTVKSEAKFYQVEDGNGVHEYLQSRIKAQSNEYLEGYENVDKWEDLSNYYVYYCLSKSKYYALKEKRKNEAIAKASGYYKTAIRLEEQSAYIDAIVQYAVCIDVLSGYTNEATEAEINGNSVDLVSESIVRISNIIKSFNIVANAGITGSEIKGLQTSFTILSTERSPVFNIPAVFEYTGGFLVKDRVKTDDEGKVSFPDLPKSTGQQKLTLKIDLKNLGRQVSKNLLVRKIIENQKAAELQIVVN